MSEVHILADDLRNVMVSCGDCDEGEMMETGHYHETPKHVSDAIQRNQTAIEALQAETTRAIATLTQSVLHIKEMNDSQNEMLRRMEDRQRVMQDSLTRYNSVRERLDSVERVVDDLPKTYILTDVFNGAMKSLRSSIAMVQWAFGLGFAAVSSLLVLLLRNSG